MTVTNITAAARLVRGMVKGTEGTDPTKLLLTGASIWLANVIVFALWYWEFDRGGPGDRAAAVDPHPDFVFPQMQAPDLAPHDWEPSFVDYLYLFRLPTPPPSAQRTRFGSPIGRRCS